MCVGSGWGSRMMGRWLNGEEDDEDSGGDEDVQEGMAMQGERTSSSERVDTGIQSNGASWWSPLRRS